MRPDHSASDFAPAQPLLATPLDAVAEALPRRQVNVLARATFCFAWLFGLEPFLAGSGDEALGSRLDRH